MRLACLLAVVPVGVAVLASCTSSSSPAPVVACGTDNLATTASDVTIVTEYEAGFYWASIDAIPANLYTFTVATSVTSTAADAGASEDGDPAPAVVSAQADTAASAVAAAVGAYYPNGCATATAAANVVTFTLNNCSGPLGLMGVTGTVTATLTATGNGQIGTSLSGTNITSSDGVTISTLNTSGTTTIAANGQKTLTATSLSIATGPFGNTATHGGNYTLVWPTPTSVSASCGTLNGTFSGVGTGADSGSTLQLTNYVACANECPQSGTVMQSLNGSSVTLTFNGTSNAACTSTAGSSAAVAIKCP